MARGAQRMAHTQLAHTAPLPPRPPVSSHLWHKVRHARRQQQRVQQRGRQVSVGCARSRQRCKHVRDHVLRVFCYHVREQPRVGAGRGVGELQELPGGG